MDLARWLHEQTGERVLTMAGGTALNCVANSRIWRETPFERRVGAAGRRGCRHLARRAPCRSAADHGEPAAADAPAPRSAAAGPTTSSAAWLRGRACRSARPPTCRRRSPRCWPPTGSSPGSTAAASSGPRALGHRSLLAHPGRRGEPGAAERCQGPGAVPAGRARWCCWSTPTDDLLRRPDSQPVHAVRARRETRMAGTHPGRGARRRHRPDPDRRPATAAAAGRHAARSSTAAPGCRW